MLYIVSQCSQGPWKRLRQGRREVPGRWGAAAHRGFQAPRTAAPGGRLVADEA